MLLAVSVSVFGVSRSAHAGHYAVTFSGGVTEWEYFDNNYPVSVGMVSGSRPWAWRGYEMLNLRTDWHGNAHGNIHGPVKASFDWMPDNLIDLPPNRIVVLETASAEWFCKTNQHSGSASSGLPNEVRTPHQNNINLGESCSGYKYTAITKPGEHFELTGNPQAEVTGLGDYRVMVDEIAHVRASYFARVVERDVILVRAGAHDETMNPDGSMRGDTVYSYWDRAHFGGDYRVETWTHFNAFLYGEWHNPSPSEFPDIKWNCGRTDLFNPFVMELLIPDGSPYLWSAESAHHSAIWKGDKSTAQSKTIVVTATDPVDGFTADAKYELKFHDRVEDLKETIYTLFMDAGYTGREFNGDKPKGFPMDIPENLGGWSWSVSTPSIVPWFPVFSISYSPVSAPVTRHAILPWDLPLGYAAKIKRRYIFKSHLFEWWEFDEGGQVFADPADHTKMHSDAASELFDVDYSVDPPYLLNTGVGEPVGPSGPDDPGGQLPIGGSGGMTP